MHCNPASPWYDEDNKSSIDDFDTRKYKKQRSSYNISANKTEGVVLLSFVLLPIVAMIMFDILNQKELFNLTTKLIPFLIFGILMPYVVCRAIYISIKSFIRNKNN